VTGSKLYFCCTAAAAILSTLIASTLTTSAYAF
jgi:hypothetical protein